MSVNRVIILGRLGKDPELKSTQTGSSICSFSVATSKQWKDKQGQKQEKTEWHSCQAFGKTADICGRYLKKGSLCYVEGELTTRSWDDKNGGGKKYATSINIESVQFLSDKAEKKDEPNQIDKEVDKYRREITTSEFTTDDLPF